MFMCCYPPTTPLSKKRVSNLFHPRLLIHVSSSIFFMYLYMCFLGFFCSCSQNSANLKCTLYQTWKVSSSLSVLLISSTSSSNFNNLTSNSNQAKRGKIIKFIDKRQPPQDHKGITFAGFASGFLHWLQ